MHVKGDGIFLIAAIGMVGSAATAFFGLSALGATGVFSVATGTKLAEIKKRIQAKHRRRRQ